ncbi:MAG: hypothetical protein ACLGSD_05650 [Acidobacteriota bacterium]
MRTAVRSFHDLSRRFAPLVILALSLPCAFAQGTHLWTQSQQDEFEKGTPVGVAIGSDNMLRPAPALKEVLTTPSTFVWSLATDKAGNVYAGTGAPATVLRIGPDGKPFTLFETRDVSVQVVRMGPDGSLYAATIPSGKVYKLNPAATTKQDDSTATVVFDPAKLDSTSAKTAKDSTDKSAGDNRSRYVWDITFDSAGRMYIATGGPAAVYRVNLSKPGAAPELFFKSDEQHIRCLAWDPKGNLIAGTDGSGLVYRISPEGKGYVLYEASRREISAIAVGPDGSIYAASVGDKSRNPLPPLPVQGTGVITFTVVQPQSLQAVNASSSAPEGSEIYALQPNQAPRKLWSGKDEIAYALLAQKDGLLVLTGNQGRLFKIHDDGTFADVGHLDAQQALTLAEGTRPGTLLIGTGNTGKLVEFGAQGSHEYASDVLDAGALARFGRIEVEPGSSAYELLTRSGNVEQPIRGWSDWQPVNNGQIASPPGRFLQWKAILRPAGVLGSVGVNYLPVNAAPVVDELVVVPGARLNQSTQTNQPQTINISLPSSGNATVSFDGAGSGPLSAVKDRNAVTARWAAHDDNGDDLNYSLYLRGDGEQKWWLLKDHITDKAYTFDGNLLPDGGYWLKVVASDAPSHTPGDALTGEKVSDRFEIDTTPPVVTGLQASESGAGSIHIVFDAEDAMSPVVKAEYSIDAGRWQYIDPVGKISDSRREHYDFEIPAKALEGKPGEHLITVRAYDRHDNVGLAKTTFHTAK